MSGGMLLTFTLLLLRPYLPERRLDLLQADSGARPMLMNEEADHPAGDTLIAWVDRSRLHLRCETDSTKALPLCGMFFDLNERVTGLGRDFSSFRDVIVALRFRGANEHVRLSLGTFIPGRSVVTDHRTWRPVAGYVRVDQLNKPVTLKLSAWSVPDWWLMSEIATAFASESLDFANCVTLTIDVPYHHGRNSVDFQLLQLELRGERLSASTLYALILSGWTIAGLVFVARRVQAALRGQEQHLALIDALAERESKLRSEQTELRRMATVDALTGVLNRRGMDLVIQDLRQRGQSRMAILVVDIDHFKRINDSLGHEAGDRTLRRVAAIMTQCLRADDIICRWGGEEFVICAPCSLIDATLVAEKLRQRIAVPHSAADEARQVTVSVGVSRMLGVDDFEAAVHRADGALYRAKREGRNRVAVDENLFDPPAELGTHPETPIRPTLS